MALGITEVIHIDICAWHDYRHFLLPFLPSPQTLVNLYEIIRNRLEEQLARQHRLTRDTHVGIHLIVG